MNQENHEPGKDRLVAAIGVVGAIGVVAGAFGAHALRDILGDSRSLDAWQTAVLYNLMHAVACLAAVFWGGSRMQGAVWSWLLGITLFSGSLYCLALGGPRWLGPITPIGGALLSIGWIWVAAGALAGKRGRMG